MGTPSVSSLFKDWGLQGSSLAVKTHTWSLCQWWRPIYWTKLNYRIRQNDRLFWNVNPSLLSWSVSWCLWESHFLSWPRSPCQNKIATTNYDRSASEFGRLSNTQYHQVCLLLGYLPWLTDGGHLATFLVVIFSCRYSLNILIFDSSSYKTACHFKF